MSNLLSIGKDITESSAGLQEHAKSKGFWDGSGDFDFAEAFSAPPSKCAINEALVLPGVN